MEQLPPVEQFGREFVLVATITTNRTCDPTPPACCNDTEFCSRCTEVYNVVAAYDDTTVQWTGSLTNGSKTLQAGEWAYISIDNQEVASIASTQPILIGHYFGSYTYYGENNTVGDPSFSLVQRRRSYKRKYIGATCIPGFNVGHYANMIVKAGTSEQMKLNGATFLNANDTILVPGTEYEAFKNQFDCSGIVNMPASTDARAFVIEHVGNEKFACPCTGLGLSQGTSLPVVCWQYSMGCRADCSLPDAMRYVASI